jgi:hypothetical protein
VRRTATDAGFAFRVPGDDGASGRSRSGALAATLSGEYVGIEEPWKTTDFAGGRK